MLEPCNVYPNRWVVVIRSGSLVGYLIERQDDRYGPLLEVVQDRERFEVSVSRDRAERMLYRWQNR